MRKSIDGLVSIVESKFDFTATDKALFVFPGLFCKNSNFQIVICRGVAKV